MLSFGKRSFDLSGFQKASEELRAASAVDRRRTVDSFEALVAELERRSIQEHEPTRKAVEALGGRVLHVFWLVNAVVVEVPDQAVPRLLELPGLRFLEPDTVHSQQAFIRTSTNRQNHRVDALQKAGLRGKGVAIAVIDGGIDISSGLTKRPHATFYPFGNPKNTTGGGLLGSRITRSLALGLMGQDDVNGHGTSVAAIAAGARWNNSKLADDGQSPDSSLVNYNIALNSGGSTLSSFLALAWQAAAKDQARYGIRVALCAYSGSPDPRTVAQISLDAMALNAGILPVVAAGNYGYTTKSSQSCANGLAVGGVTESKGSAVSGKTLWPYSSRGPMYGDITRTYPDLVANGVHVVTPLRDNATVSSLLTGTSASAPQVAGAAALLFSVAKTSSTLAVKAAILATTEDIAHLNTLKSRNALGVGYLRTDMLLGVTRNRSSLLLQSTLTAATRSRRYSFPVIAGRSYGVAIAWNRSLLLTSKWSDLRLTLYRGKQVLATADSPRNLYEKLNFVAARSETLTLEVASVSLVTVSEPFALAAAESPPAFSSGSIQSIGAGCPGTGGTRSVSATVPKSMTKQMGNASSTLPLGYYNHHFQQVFARSELPKTFTAGGVEFREPSRSLGFRGSYWVDLSISLGYSTSTPSKMSTSFASNISGTLTSVLKKQRVSLPPLSSSNVNPSNWKIQIPFTRPFVFLPKLGQTLLFDSIRHGSSAGTSPANYPVDAVFSYTNPLVTRLFSTSLTAATGSLRAGLGAAMQFFVSSKSGAIPQLTVPSKPVIAAPIRLELSLGPASAPVLMMLGFSKTGWGLLKLPFSLSPYGGGSCMLRTGPALALALLLDSKGTGALNLPIPDADRLIGKSVYVQALLLDAGANALGMSLSGGLQLGIGGQR